MKVNKEASAKAFGKVDLDYFIQSSIENAESEEELDAEVKIFQNALDFSNIKIRDCIVPRTEVVAVDLTTTAIVFFCCMNSFISLWADIVSGTIGTSFTLFLQSTGFLNISDE